MTSSDEIEEFGRILVQEVRDEAVRACDALLKGKPKNVVARRWKNSGCPPEGLSAVLPDIVDETIFQVLKAIDQELLRLRFVSAGGGSVDLSEQGQGDLGGWFMGGWRGTFAKERFFDDFADLDGG